MKKLFIEFEYMEEIKDCAKRMLELSIAENCIVEGLFNGILLTTQNMNSVDDILNQRDSIINNKIEKYKKLTTYIRKQELEKQKKILMKQKTNSILEEFKNLNLYSIQEVLLWFNKVLFIKNEININYFEILHNLYQTGYLPLKKYLKSYNYDKSNEFKTVFNYISTCDNFEESGIYLLSRIMQDIEDFGSVQSKEGIFTRIYCSKISNDNKKSKKLK